MILATYQLSTPINPRQFEESPIFGDDAPFNTMVKFGGRRDGEFRVSLSNVWGVVFFHTTGQMDIEIDFMQADDITDMLQDICDTFFVKMELYQPLHIPYLPLSVKPDAKKVDSEDREC